MNCPVEITQSEDKENSRIKAQRHEQPAVFWQRSDSRHVTCLLCPQRCRIAPGQSGMCRVRVNRDGQLYASAYGKITSLTLDPIEKKPLHAFHSGSRILSVGSYGCNFRCHFCQNWQISQNEADWQLIMPEKLVSLAERQQRNGNIGLAYTYNEPLINYEYVMTSARLARSSGLKNVLVTNGSINTEPLLALLPYIDAMNIDLKSWRDSYYRQYCHGLRAPVMETIRNAVEHCHVELTTLLLPGLNDAEEDIAALAAWIASLDPAIVLHLTRHHPDYLMPEPPSIAYERMQKLADIARQHLATVVLGNIAL